MEYLFIYLLQMSNVIECLSVITVLSSVSFIVVCIIFFSVNYDEITQDDDCHKNKKATFKTLKNNAILFVIVSIFLSAIPTKQTLLLMGGVYLGKKAVNTVITDEKVKKVNQIIELELDKRIGELKRNANNDNSAN